MINIILIDSREPNNIRDKLSKKLEVSQDFLEVGDYLLGNGICIERKTGSDFLASIMDKRIFTQLNNMNQFDNPMVCIITDNIWKDFYNSKSRYIYNSYLGTLSTIASSYPKVSILFFDSEKDFIKFLEYLEGKITSDKKSTRPSPAMRKAKKLSDRKENALCAADGVSVRTSKILLEEYGNIEKLCLASEEELNNVDKVNKRQAKGIYDLLH